MKAHYYLSQAFLHTYDYDAALTHGLRAHEICAKTNDKSLTQVTAIVLRCKKERWDHNEMLRIKQAQELETMLLGLMARDTEEMLTDAGDDEFEKGIIREENEQRAAQMKEVFDRARAQGDKKRVVPEWVIDDISFGIMVDPVIVSFHTNHPKPILLILFWTIKS